MEKKLYMDKIKLLALFGESGAGKNSIQHWLIKNLENTHKVISYTTRPPRDNEKDGEEYYFISNDEFINLLLKDKLLEYSVFNNWQYGTSIDVFDLQKINIGIFNPRSIEKLLTHSNTIDILPVWIQAKEKDRLFRSLKREMNPDCTEICRRFLADLQDFSNINFNYEIFLNNQNNNDNFYGLLNRPKVFNFLNKGQS